MTHKDVVGEPQITKMDRVEDGLDVEIKNLFPPTNQYRRI